MMSRCAGWDLPLSRSPPTASPAEDFQMRPSLHIQAARAPATSTLNCPELVPSLGLQVATQLSLPLPSLPSTQGLLSHRHGSHRR